MAPYPVHMFTASSPGIALATILLTAFALAHPAAVLAAGSENESAASAKATGAEAAAETADASRLFAAVVKVQTRAVPNARSAATLGQDRDGSGIVIGDGGLILTIGYLIVEADDVKVVDSRGRTLPAKIVGYDHATGLGLVRAIGFARHEAGAARRVGADSPSVTR